MKTVFLSISILFFAGTFAQTTYVPDDDFENYLETHDAAGNVVPLGDPTSMGNGIANDDYVFTNRINTVTNLVITSEGISDLTGIEAFSALETLDCSYNYLTTLNLSQNTSLISLNCYRNELTSLDVSASTLLQTINCSENQLTSLDLTANCFVNTIDCYKNPLTSLTINCIANVKYLDIIETNLTSINLDNYTSLEKFFCGGNSLPNTPSPLNSISLNNTPALKELSVYQTSITSLTVNNKPNLIDTKIQYNVFLTSFTYSNNSNPNAFLLYVNQYIASTLSISNSTLKSLQVVAKISSLDLTTVNGLNYIYVGETNLTSLDLSAKNSLIKITCNSNSLLSTVTLPTTLTNLEELTIADCNLNSFDVSNRTNLKLLNIGGNQLSSINLTNTPALENLRVDFNNLSNIDLSGSPALSILRLDENNFSSIDFSLSSNLKELYMRNLPNLLNLDLSLNTQLKKLECIGNNSLVRLDLSANTQIKNLDCTNNTNLKALNVKSGNNSNFNSFGASFDARNNPSLYCINVDDAVAANAGTGAYSGWFKDAQATYSTTCYTYVPDDNFEQALIDLGYDTVLNDYVANVFIENVTTLSISNKNIADLTGIEGFTSLQTLDVSNNNLTSVNLSQNTALQDLNIRNNQLSALDVSALTGLTSLKCNDNSLTALSVQTNTSLATLWCYGNQIQTLDLDANINLTDIRVQSNNLNRLTIKNSYNTNITSFSAHTNPNLTCIEVTSTAHFSQFSGNVDSQTSFSTNCHYDETYVPDDDFENYLETHDASGNIVPLGDANSMGNGVANDNYVTTSKINGVTNLNISNTGIGISDLTGIEDFTALESLNCSKNSLTSLNLSQNSALVSLDCSENFLTSINITQNTGLQTLICYTNSLTTLDVSQNTALITLSCFDNSLSTLSVSQNTALQTLNCYTNSLTALDVSQNTALTALSCFGNSLTTLDVSQNTGLTTLNCQNNSIETLDLSLNTALTSLNCENNQLTQLNIKNGNNTNIPNNLFLASNNPNLSCIEVDNPTWSTSNWTNIDATTSFNTNCHYNETYIPDNYFENYLETHDAAGNVVSLGDPNSMGNGIANDDYVLTSRINTVTNLDVSLLGILDLTGIEDFTALTNLNCSGNNGLSIDISQNTALTNLNVSNCTLSSLDVSSNTALTNLNCSYNNLSTLNVNQNTALTYLNCGGNNLTSLNLSQNTALTTLYCNSNQLSSLDVSQNTNLTYLETSQNQITYLDVSQNTALTELYCYTNQLTSLSVYYNNNLQKLHCANNQITNLILPNVKPNLIEILASNNQLTSLDISDYPNVNSILCNNNQLQQLNVKNGNNTNITNTNFNATNNPNLSCIEVDDATWSTSNWTNIDATASFSNNCNFNETNVPDDNFEAYLETHDANGNVVPVGDPNSMGNGIFNDNYVLTSRINTVTSLNVSGLNISDLTGIEDFTALQILNCSNNNITFLITDQNTSLIELDCSYNQISSLGVTPTTIQKVICNDNNMNDLVVNPATLKYLYCQNNNLQQLDVSQMFQLIELNCNANQISNLNLINSSANLTILRCEDNLLTGINTDTNTNLTILECGLNNIFSLNLTTNVLLQELEVYYNSLTSIDLSQNIQLERLDCRSNNLSSLNLSQNTQLNDLDFSDNQISSIDLTLNTLLQRIILDSNQLSQLDVSQNTQLLEFGCNNNQLSQIDVSQNSQLVLFTCNNNPTLTNISMANGNNINITNFQANNNPYLACIEVDDISIPNSPVWQKDDNASYSENCTLKTKIWETGQWTNGAPTITDIAIIRDNYYTSSAGNIEAKTITIDSGYNLIIESGDYAKIAQNTINNGDIYIDNTASYVQINDLAKNLGNGLYKVSVVTTSLADEHRFTYFSSPVKNETLQVFSSWAKMNYIWNFDTAIQDWNILTGNETMLPTVGYALKPAASNTFPFNAQTIFNGEFNNGVYTANLIYNIGGLDDDNNLIGNPYPSAIDATMLLNQNPGTNAFYFWTHKSALGTNGYLGDDYAIWNNSGGIASSSGSPAPTGYIANGQGFFVDATATGTITFNNAMRVTGNNTDFRRPNTNENKLWLNLTNTNQYFSQILIVFSENGSNNFDPTYDAVRLNSGSITRFYTVGQNNKNYAIETRNTLTEQQTIPLGIETLQTSEFIFEIDHLQNFEDINIYLKDHLLGNIHNLKNSAYHFTINQIGVINNRFELLINKNSLLIDSETLKNTITVYQNTQKELIIKSNGSATLKNIKVYNLLGKQLINVSKINENIYRMKSPFNTGTTLFITTELSNGEKKHKKFYIKN